MKAAIVLLVFAVAQWTDARDLIDAMGYGVMYRDGSAVATSKDGVLWRSCGCGNTCGSYSPCRPNYAPAPRPRPPCSPCGGSSYDRYAPAPPPPPPCRRRGGSGSFGGSGCGPIVRPMPSNPGIPDGPSIIRIVPSPDESDSFSDGPIVRPMPSNPGIPDGPSIIRIVQSPDQSGSFSGGAVVRPMPSNPGIEDGSSIIRIVQSPDDSDSFSDGPIVRPMPSNPGIPDGPSIIRIVQSPDQSGSSSGSSSGGGCSTCGRKRRSLRK